MSFISNVQLTAKQLKTATLSNSPRTDLDFEYLKELLVNIVRMGDNPGKLASGTFETHDFGF